MTPAAEPSAPDAHVAPSCWPWALASPPLASSDVTPWHGAPVGEWSGTSPLMVQPPLDHHYVVMHLGGAKRVTRRADGPSIDSVAELQALTIVPAGTAYVWRTTGPIAFAHLYLRPGQLARSIEENGGVAPSDVPLADSVGCRDPLLESLFLRMLAEIRHGADAAPMLLDGLLESFLVGLAHRHASGFKSAHDRPFALAPHRLRRVLAFIEEHAVEPLSLADLAQVAGASPWHFSHGFQAATGRSPYRYVVDRRVEHARVLLMTGNASLTEVGASSGFSSRRQFSVMFKRRFGVGPKQFQLTHAPRLRASR